MSVCDTCKDPGACCKTLMLSGVTEESFPTKLEAQAIVAAWPFEPNGLPFIPVKVVEGYWVFTCPVLDWKTGRCSDYENRPGLCRGFEPMSDPLCVMTPEKISQTPLQFFPNS